MDYGELITRSWNVFWRFKYLWLLGILGGAGEYGGGGGGGGFNFNAPTGGREGGNLPGEVTDWFAANVGLLVVVAVLLVLLFLVYFVVSCIATGALIRAVAEHDADRPFGFGPAWQAGLTTFLRILGLRLLVLLLVLLVAAVFGGLVALGIVSAVNERAAGLVVAILLGTGLGLLLIPVAIGFSIAVTFATRALVLEQRGVFDALGRGFRLLFARLGRSLLVWLIAIGLGILAALVVGAAVAVVALPLVLVGVGVYSGLGAGPALTAGVVLFAIFLILSTAISGIPGTYIATYWTLAFRRMEIDRPPRPVAAQPVPR